MNIYKTFPFLKAAENRRTFFDRIAQKYPRTSIPYLTILQAYNDSKDAFREVSREGGERYFEHKRMVALIVMDYLRVSDWRIIVLALIHDLVEDIPSWTIERVAQRYGEDIARPLDYLTKPSKNEFPKSEDRNRIYHARLASAPREVWLVKLPDRWHNLFTLGPCPVEKRLRKIEETIQHYLPHAEKEIILIHEIEAAIEMIREGIRNEKKK